MEYSYTDKDIVYKIDSITLEITQYLLEITRELDYLDTKFKLDSNSQRDLYLEITKYEGSLTYQLASKEPFNLFSIHTSKDYPKKEELNFKVDLTNLNFKFTDNCIDNFYYPPKTELPSHIDNYKYDVYKELYHHLIMSWNSTKVSKKYTLKQVITNYFDTKYNAKHLDTFKV